MLSVVDASRRHGL